MQYHDFGARIMYVCYFLILSFIINVLLLLQFQLIVSSWSFNILNKHMVAISDIHDSLNLRHTKKI